MKWNLSPTRRSKKHNVGMKNANSQRPSLRDMGIDARICLTPAVSCGTRWRRARANMTRDSVERQLDGHVRPAHRCGFLDKSFSRSAEGP